MKKTVELLVTFLAVTFLVFSTYTEVQANESNATISLRKKEKEPSVLPSTSSGSDGNANQGSLIFKKLLLPQTGEKKADILQGLGGVLIVSSLGYYYIHSRRKNKKTFNNGMRVF